MGKHKADVMAEYGVEDSVKNEVHSEVGEDEIGSSSTLPLCKPTDNFKDIPNFRDDSLVDEFHKDDYSWIDDYDSDKLSWDELPGTLKGVVFLSKEEVKIACRKRLDYDMYRIHRSDKTGLVLRCRYETETCNFEIKAVRKKNSSLWEVIRWGSFHSCTCHDDSESEAEEDSAFR